MATRRTKPKKRRKKPAKRDHKAEYQQRIARGSAMGLPLSVSRGHPRPGEVGLREIRQLRRAAALRSPGQGGGAKEGDVRDAAREFVAAIADVRAVKPERARDEFYVRSQEADMFVEVYVAMAGVTRQEAYTLWFSP